HGQTPVQRRRGEAPGAAAESQGAGRRGGGGGVGGEADPRTRPRRARPDAAGRDGAQPARGSGRVPRGLGDPLPPTTPAARPPPASMECRDRVEVFATEKMLREWPAFDALAKSFAEGEVCLRVAGLTGAARPAVVAELL